MTVRRFRGIMATLLGLGLAVGLIGEGKAQTLSQSLYSGSSGSSWWSSGGSSSGRFFTINPDKGDLLTVGAGAVTLFNFKNDDEHTAGQFRLEWRPNEGVLFLRPFAGLEVSTQGATYLYGGLLTDIMFGRHVYLTPNMALGWYSHGNGRDLGYPLEFRSGLELGWRFDGGYRAGVSMHHLSNANISDQNPGVEEVLLNVSVPLVSVTNLFKK